jgi:hypothetical protein
VPHGWLIEWKQAAPGRTISLETVLSDDHRRPSEVEKVNATWRSAGLSGRPEFKLELHGPQESFQPRATVYLGSEELKALIVSSNVGSSDHWLDKLKIESPYYVTVDREGHYEQHGLVNWNVSDGQQ